MRFSFLIYLLLIHTHIFPQVHKDSLAVRYGNTIIAADLSEYLHVLASDSLEGRETGEMGQKKAAGYIASKFREAGVEPGVRKKNGESYFQQFELIKKQWDEVYLKVNNRKKVFLEDFYVYGDIEFPEEEKAEIIFAGHGIDSKNYTDYLEYRSGKPINKPLNVKDKIVIIFPGDPILAGKSLVTRDSLFSSWANDWRKKAGTAKAKGAKAVFIIVGKNYEEFRIRRDLLKEHIAKPSLSFTYKEKPGSAVFISIDLAAELLGVSTTDLIKYNEARSVALAAAKFSQYPEMAKTIKNHVSLKPKRVYIKCSIKKSRLTTENVLGFIEGSDKKDEIIVLTAHYDHLGIEGGRIYYGADDDGSGTAALIEIAQAFAQAKKEGHGPRRSILIMPVTAEEKGLMGSEYYADNPEFPLQNTVVNLNIDMIGRLDSAHANNPDYVYLIGTNRLSKELHEVSERVNEIYCDLELDYTFNSPNDPNRFYYRSDHYNFAKNKIPVIFYFNGMHDDYHQPTDTVDKIIFSKIEKITRLIFYTTWELANREKRIEADVNDE